MSIEVGKKLVDNFKFVTGKHQHLIGFLDILKYFLGIEKPKSNVGALFLLIDCKSVPCLLCLFFERTYAAFKDVKYVLDTVEVLGSLLKLSLGLLFSVSVF